MKKILTLLLILTLVLSMGIGSYADTSMEAETIGTYSKEITEKEYLEGMARELNITYDQAALRNEMENMKYFSMGGIGTRGLDEVAKYKQVTRFLKINGSNSYLTMASEIKYAYSIPEGRAIEIIRVGAPLMSITGATSFHINGGGFNIENFGTSARISQTATLTFTITDSVGVSAGIGDIFSVDTSTSGETIVTTVPRTFVMSIKLSEL